MKTYYVSISAADYKHFAGIVEDIKIKAGEEGSKITCHIPGTNYTSKKFDNAQIIVVYLPKDGVLGRGAVSELHKALEDTTKTVIIATDTLFITKPRCIFGEVASGKNWKRYSKIDICFSAFVSKRSSTLSKDLGMLKSVKAVTKWDEMWMFF